MFKQIREDIACILQRDPAARSRFEILTCYPGLHAILMHRLANRLWRGRWHWAARFLSHIGRVLTGIEIHPGATIGRRVFIDHGMGVVIGETAEVGDDCTIYQGVTLGGTRLYKGEKRHPTLATGVVVGAGAQILGGFTVGERARVGSNAVVVKPVPAGATVVGNPARLIPHPERARSEDTAATRAAATETPAPKTPAPAATPAPDEAPATSAQPAPIPADAATAARKASSPCDGPAGAEAPWSAEPLQQMLQRGRGSAPSGAEADPGGDGDAFAPYGVARGDDDPIVKVLHELINHTAKQDERMQRLCHALEELGQRVENGQPHFDAERLNRMVD